METGFHTISRMEYEAYNEYINETPLQYFNSSIKFLNSGHLSLKFFERPMRKKVEGPKKKKDEVKTDDEKLAWTKKNRNRSMRQFIEYVRHNSDKFKTFGTLTFDPKKVGDYDRDDALRYWNTYATRVRKEFPDVAFIKVDERHKSGKVHFHFLSTAPIGHALFPVRKTKKLWNRKKKRYYSLRSYDLKYWDYGFSDAKDLRLEAGQVDENFDVGAYMAKYMAKNFEQLQSYDENGVLIDRYHEKKYTSINAHLLEKPETIRYNREYNKADELLMNWLKYRGYEMAEKMVMPLNKNGTMAPRFIEYSCKLSKKDVYDLKLFLRNIVAMQEYDYRVRNRNRMVLNPDNQNEIILLLPKPENFGM